MGADNTAQKKCGDILKKTLYVYNVFVQVYYLDCNLTNKFNSCCLLHASKYLQKANDLTLIDRDTVRIYLLQSTIQTTI